MTTVWNFLTGFSPSEVDKTKLNQLRNTIRLSLQNSVINETYFLPESDIKNLVTPDKTKLLLPNAKPELIDFICKDAKKLFLIASLHHGNLQGIMDTFRQHGMTDKYLPIRDLTSEDRYCDVHTEGLQRVCSHEKALEAFHDWDGHDVWNFYNDQWKFCAPILSMECSSQEFHPKHILPFIQKGTTQKDGRFSTVVEAVIHPSHQIGRGPLKSNIDQTWVALKELKSLSEPNYNVHVSWLNEANALFQIAELRHKHLISQATAFKQGERRFIVLEWANGGTLRDIWQKESHDGSVLDGGKVMRVLEELTGIASALSRLHGTNTKTRTAMAMSADRRRKNPMSRPKTILSQGQGVRLTVPKIPFEGVSSDDDYDSSDYGEEQYWRHGDLKPNNILQFIDDKSSWLGTLKIAGLGLVQQHAFATTQRQDPTQQKYLTSHYEAPEVITTMNSPVPRSRRYDIWSMGCIIFEFAIWLLYGYEEGLKSFYNEGKDIDAYRETLYFTADVSTRQAQVSDAARRWINHILEVDPECNRATPSVIRDLVVLVRDKLLVVDLPNERMSQEDIKRCRASADDLDSILQKMKRKALDDENRGGRYLSSEESRTGVFSPRPRQVQRASFFSTSSGVTSRQGPETTILGHRGVEATLPTTLLTLPGGGEHMTITDEVVNAEGAMPDQGSDSDVEIVESPRSFTFDHDVFSERTRPSTIPTSHPSNKAPMPLQESVEDCDADTTYSVDTLSDDTKLRYLQVFADQLIKDIHASGDSCIDDLAGYLDPVLREFAWKLHGESSNPFQWGASVLLHHKRKKIIDLLGSCPKDIDVLKVREDESFTSDDDENEEEDDSLSSRVAFVKPRVMVMEWVGNVEESSSATQEATEEPFTGPQEDLPQLPHYDEFVGKSDAYQWLLTKIRQHGRLTVGNPDAMLAIRTRILKLRQLQEPLRKMSSRKPPALVRMTFNLDWNPVRFVQDAGFGAPLGEAFLRVLCLTGSWDEAQATTVLDYMDQTWPRSGRVLLALLQKLLSIAEGDECSYKIHEPKSRIGSAHPKPMTTELTAKVQPPSACTITVTGSLYFVSEIGEQIGWLASALRPSPETQGAMAWTPRAQDLQVHAQEGGSQEIAIIGSLTMSFDFQPSETENSASGYCWRQLFSSPILVQGYPILRRWVPSTGLEMPLNIMSTIIGSKQVVQLGERVFLKGFNMLLIATLAVADVMVWHLLISDKPDERISYIDNRLDSIEVETSPGFSLRMLEARRHVIGWCLKATDFCGDPTANQNLKASGLPKPPASIVIDRMYLEAGSDVVAGVNISFNQKQKPFWLEREKDYPSMLKWISLQPVVFYDVEDRRAWFIDGASALLHLIRVSLYQDENNPASTYDWVFEASKLKDQWTGASGRLRAIRTLTSWDNLDLNIYVTGKHRRDDGTSETKYSTFERRVEKILHSIEILIDWQAQTASKDGIRFLQKLDLRRDIIGFDILDVITPLGPIHPRIKYIESWGPGWVDLITSIGITTIFGNGFGDLIRPDPNEAVCHNWKCIPKGVEYLAASVSTLQMLYTERLLRTEPGLSAGELTSQIEWISPGHPFNMCRCLQSNIISSNNDAGDKKCDIDPVQFLVGKKSWMSRLTSRGLMPININTLDEKGAVVFGHQRLLGLKSEGKTLPGQQKTDIDTSALSSNASNQGILQGPRVSSTASISTTSAGSTDITVPSLRQTKSGEKQDERGSINNGGGGERITKRLNIFEKWKKR